MIKSILLLVFSFQVLLAVENDLPLPGEWNGRSPVVRITSAERGTDIALCSGVMITQKVILTAAHCFHNYHETRRLKIENLETKETHTSLFKTIAKSGYKTDFHDRPVVTENGYDIGLIILRSEVKFKWTPFELAQSDENLNQYLPNIFLVATSDVRSQNDSAVSIPIANLKKHEIAGKEYFFGYSSAKANAGPCEGDSGGGVFYYNKSQWTLIGIQSTKTASHACGGAGDRGFFVSVAKNRDWILSVVNGSKN
jgi:hypothetical protein